jgi:hypothetical protein
MCIRMVIMPTGLAGLFLKGLGTGLLRMRGGGRAPLFIFSHAQSIGPSPGAGKSGLFCIDAAVTTAPQFNQ